MNFQSKILVFSAADDKEQKGDRGAVTVTAAKLSFCSQYCDLRDEQGNIVATLTWTGNMQVRELYPAKVRSAAR